MLAQPRTTLRPSAGEPDFALISAGVEAGSSSDRTGTSHARTLAQRLASPYFNKLVSIAAMERESVVTTEKR